MTTREEGLNNPMGLKCSSIVYRNEVRPSKDAAFKQFVAMQDGVRAGMRNLLAYYRTDGCKTPRQILNRWAPAGENDTSAYIDYVCEQTGFQPDEDVHLEDQDSGFGLAHAICCFENGEMPCDAETILQGVQSAYNG